MVELTLAMIKPDGVRKGLTDEVVGRIERAGLRVAHKLELKLDRAKAEELYAIHRGKEFFEQLVEHVLSGPVVIMLVEGEGAIAKMRELVGATDPARAAKGTIRGDFGESITRNVIHAADSKESAEYEISLFRTILLESQHNL